MLFNHLDYQNAIKYTKVQAVSTLKAGFMATISKNAVSVLLYWEAVKVGLQKNKIK